MVGLEQIGKGLEVCLGGMKAQKYESSAESS